MVLPVCSDFGEVSVVTGAARTSTVKALEDLEVVALPGGLMREVMEAYPKVRAVLIRMVEGRALGTMAKLPDLEEQ